MIRHLAAVGMTAILALLLADCSGGGSASVAPTGANPPASVATPVATKPSVPPNTIENVSFAVTVPIGGSSTTASATKRTPQYVPPSTQSFTVTQTENGGSPYAGSPVVANVGTGASCTGTTALTCTASTTGALGQDGYTINTYSGSNGTGALLSTNTVTEIVLAGVANVFPVTLNPVLASLVWNPTASSCTVFGCTQALALLPEDTTGAQIIGPGSYVNASNTLTPIALTVPGHLALKTGSASAANLTLNQATDNNVATVVFDGLGGAGTYVVHATAGAVAPALYTLTVANGTITVAPNPVRVGVDQGDTSTTFTASEPGFSGTFTEFDTCAGIVTITPSGSPTGPTATYSVTQIGGGTCTATILDGHGGSASENLISTTLSFVVQ